MPQGSVRERARRALTWLRKQRLLPPAGAVVPLRELLPRRGYHWLSAMLLWLAMAYVLRATGKAQWGFLTDPLLQNDDVRTSLFAFHRHEPDHALANDPVAVEMLPYVPPLVRGMYRVFVPLTNLFVAVKLVQGVCVLLVFASAWMLLRARRAGLGTAMVLLFLFLHTSSTTNRLAGGLPRAFAFPCFALWIAGALGGRERVRWLSALLAGATYPSALAMILAAEGLFVFRDGVRKVVLRRLARYGALIVAAVLVTVPSLPSRPGDHVYTLAEAGRDPAFGSGGRLKQLPLADPGKEIAKYFVEPFAEYKAKPKTESALKYRSYWFLGPLLGTLAMLLLVATGLSARAHAASAFFAGSLVMYAASVLFAFRLYAPERFYHYGMPPAGIALATVAVGLLAPKVSRARRATLRNVAALALVGTLVHFTGASVKPENTGMGIDGRKNADLYAFVRTLPVESRFLAHPTDGDDLPFWGARGTVVSYETLQPWLVNEWQRQLRRAEDALRAMYATDRDALLRYCEANEVTHILVNDHRYGADFRAKAGLFQPLGGFVAGLLTDATEERLLLREPPAEATVWRGGRFRVVSVEGLRRAWGM
ncbi:MAG: hypothetical protein FJ096_00710 [Deltaproteobacteria bacterium]|nr:hypothetical protein [Deltaproteobacteria bacterium]